MKYLIIILLIVSSCNLKTTDDITVEVFCDTPNMGLKMYYQNNYFDNYTEEKAVLSNSKETNTYIFEVQSQNVQRFRIDFDDFDNSTIRINKIVVTQNDKSNVIEGNELLSFFKFNTAISPTLKNNQLVLELKNKKLDPYFVSKNIQINF